MKRIINIAFLSLVLLFSNCVFATGDAPVSGMNSKATISGKVVDNKTGESLAGVAIAIEGTDLKVYSDLDGSFSINSIEPGSYNLILSLISYKNSLIENLKITPSEKEVIDIKLDAVR
ncbi:MAG: carboxypeptidase-like regulatory domain-containing protein [Bacteroidales bacterium]